VWLFHEATGAIYQVGDGTALSSSSKLMIGAEDCNKEDGTWVVIDVDAIAGLKVAVVAWLSALVISFVFIVFIDDCGFWVV
jgi:hypothetical protein